MSPTGWFTQQRTILQVHGNLLRPMISTPYQQGCPGAEMSYGSSIGLNSTARLFAKRAGFAIIMAATLMAVDSPCLAQSVPANSASSATEHSVEAGRSVIRDSDHVEWNIETRVLDSNGNPIVQPVADRLKQSLGKECVTLSEGMRTEFGFYGSLLPEGDESFYQIEGNCTVILDATHNIKLHSGMDRASILALSQPPSIDGAGISMTSAYPESSALYSKNNLYILKWAGGEVGLDFHDGHLFALFQ